MKKEKSRVKTAFLVLCALLMSLTAFLAVSVSGQSNYASATANGELYELGADGTFKGEQLASLMGKIMGKEKASYNELKAYMDERAQVTGNEISAQVNLGGKVWNVVYASETVGGDVILTLWQANSDFDSVWNKWGDDTGFDRDYPSNLYGVSCIRNFLVGSPYIESETNTQLSNLHQEQNTVYKNFIGLYGEYMSTPFQVNWQYDQSEVKRYEWESNSPNSSLYVPTCGGFYRYYNNKVNYNAWGNDKLWLPSIFETGIDAVSGLWGIDQQIRSSNNLTWLRSGTRLVAHGAECIRADGTIAGDGTVTASRGVRPAFHLNLKSAAFSAGLTVETPEFSTAAGITLADGNAVATATYAAEGRTVNLSANPAGVSVYVDSTAVTGTSFTVKEAGTHTVTMTPRSGYGWADGSIGAKTLTVIIEKATYDMPNVKWSETTEFTEDGTLHSVTLTGLPEGVTAIYSNNSASVAGSYTATVNFLYDTVNYSAPNLTDKTCEWTIKSENKEPATPDETNKPIEPDEPTEPVAATTSDGKLNGGALAAVIVVSVLAGIAIIALVVVLIEKSRKPQVIYDGGFYDNVDEDDK